MRDQPDRGATVARLQDLIERDKAALAREIHDELGGYLIASAMDVTNLRHRFAVHDEDAGRKFDRLATMLNGAIDLMRRVTEDLHPTLLDNVGLFSALSWQIRHLALRSAITCRECLPDNEIELSRTASISLFRAGQEALSMAAGNRGVTVIDFTIVIEDGRLSMQVVADGHPRREPPDDQNANAQDFLSHRIVALGGTMATSHPDAGGTVLTASVPLGSRSTLVSEDH